MALIHFGDRAFDAECVIFDKDGTLIDFDALWGPIYQKGMDALVAQFTNPEQVRAALDATLGYNPETRRFFVHGPFATAANAVVQTVVATVLYSHAQPKPTWEEAVSLAGGIFMVAMSEPPSPMQLKTPTDLPRLFGELRDAGVRIGVITSDERSQTHHTLKVLGVNHLVDFVAASNDPWPVKPAPDALLEACRRLGVSPERTAVVGDSPTDMFMGELAGAGLWAAVLTGPGTFEELAEYAHVVMNSIDDIRVAGQER